MPLLKSPSANNGPLKSETRVGKRAQQRKNFRENTRYDRKVAKLTQPRPNGFGN